MRRFPSSLLQFTSRDRFPTFCALGMLIGAVWYFSVDFEPSFASVAIGAIISGSIAVLIRHWIENAAVQTIALIAFSVSLGILAGSLATQRQSHVQIDQPIGPVMLEGWITRVEPANRGVRLVVRVHAIDGMDPARTPRKVRLTHISRLETEPGRFVRCWAVVRPPPSPVIQGDYAFDRQAWYEGLGGVGYVQGRCQGGSVGPPGEMTDTIHLEIGKVRRRLAQHVRRAAGERAGGFAAALASGDRSFLSQSDQDALRGSGLAHLLAISGLHIGIVGGLFFLLTWRGLALIEPLALRYTIKKPAAAAALIVCGAYMVLSGASISTQRAYVMALVFFGAVLFDRVALTQRSLAIAMIIIISIAPWSVLTPGFQMSFAATLVLISTYEAWKAQQGSEFSRTRGITFWLKSIAVTSTVTSLATMPFALYHFERAAGFGVIANILVMPIISLFSAPFAAGALLLAPIGLSDLALRVFGFSLEWVLAIAHAAQAWGNLDSVSLPKMPAASLAAFATAMIVICISRNDRGRNVVAVILILGGFVGWFGASRDRIHWAPSGDLYFERATGEVQRIAFNDGAGLGPLRFSETPVGEECTPAETCVRSFRGTSAAMINEGSRVDCGMLQEATVLFTMQTLPDCGQTQPRLVIDWSEVVLQNGVTVERRGDRFAKKTKPACGKRAWQKC